MRAPVCERDQETMRVVLEAVRDALANLVRQRQLIATKHGWRLP